MNRLLRTYPNLYFLILFSISFLFPFYRKPIVYVVMLLFIYWVISGDYKKLPEKLRKHKITWVFMGLFFVYVLGMTYTENLMFGWKDVVSKASILIFPLMLVTGKTLNRNHFYKVLYGFVAGNLLALVICIFNALLKYMENPELSHFFYTKLSFMIHPGYFSMYLNFAIASIVYVAFKKKIGSKSKFLAAFLVLFFLTGIFMLEAKIGIITVICNSLALVLYLIIRKKLLKQGLGILVTLIVILLGVVSYFESFNERVSQLSDALITKRENIDRTTVQSSAVRLLVWEAAYEMIREKPFFGVGTGDVKDELVDKYDQLGMTGARDKRFNTHNQLLQTTVTLGIFGLAALLLNFIGGFHLGIKDKKNLYIVFLFIIACNMLVESVLEKQSGVMFYAFFNSFLLFGYQKNEDK